MSELKPPKPVEEMTAEEGRAFLEEAIAHIEKQAGKAKQRFATVIKTAGDRLKYAEEQLAKIEEVRQKLADHQDDPEGRYHGVNMELLHRVFTATKKMMEIQIHCATQNMAASETISPLEETRLLFPEDSAEFMEARSRADVCMALFYWNDMLHGIDAIMRVTVNEPVIDCQSTEEEEARAKLADELREAMKADKNLAMLMQQLGSELHETTALLDWAKDTLRSLKDLPAESRRSLLQDPDWAKVNGKVILLGELGTKVKAYPLLAELIPEEEQTPLPFEPWSEGAATGRLGQTGKLGQTGQLGKPGSGQLTK
ncbi:MAG: hypothetical protein ACLGIN_12675 [Candidatus Sericytochromatia bacterium]